MKHRYTFCIVLMIALIAIVMNPVFAWEGWQDGEFERFGPRVDRLRFNVYANPELEYDALEADQIDYVDWDMTKERMDKYLTDPDYDYIGVADYYERGMYQIDMNCNYTMSPLVGDWGYPAYSRKINPTYDVEFRRAMAFLADKTTYVTDVLKGLGGVLETTLDPPEPWGPFKEYDGYYYDGAPFYYFDPSAAASILDAAGWEDIEPDGTRNTPGWVDAGRPNIDDYLGGGLILCMRTDKPRWMQWSNMFADELEAIGIPVERDADDRLPTLIQCLFANSFHFYAGGWSFGRDPDTAYYLWHSKWWTGLMTLNINYAHYNSSTFDYWSERLEFPETEAGAKAASQEVHRILKEDLPLIPLVYKAGGKGYHKTAVAGDHAGSIWHGLVNERGFGINTPWTSGNAHAAGYESGGMIIEGLSTDVHELNVITSYMFYDAEVIAEMYGQLTDYDPYNPTFSGDKTWHCDGWTIDTWTTPPGVMDPSLPGYPEATMITFYLDQNQPAIFHDGTPVTAQDYMFTWFFQQACGAEVDWTYGSVEYVYSVNIPDPYTINVKFDAQSIWFLHLLGEEPVLPKYVWETALDNDDDSWYTGVFPATYMDKTILQANVNPDWDPISAVMERNMFASENADFQIGSGPFKWTDDFVQGEYYALDKHTEFGHSLDDWDTFRHQGDIDMEVVTVEPSPGVIAKNVHAITASDLYYILIQYPIPPATCTPTPPGPGPYHDADLNHDGCIGFIDFSILVGHYYTVPGEGIW